MGAQPGALIGPYRILDQIGKGGMGQVFRAVHESTGQEVALKLLLKEAAEDRQIAGRFVQEYSVLAALQHANIVKVFAGQRLPDGGAYLAMERLDGISLAEWLRRQGRPAEVKSALSIGRQIADAMSKVHEVGIVHRDLKPANVIVLNTDSAAPADPIIKVIDFGIAKVPSTPTGGVDTQVLTNSGTVLGTLAYMPPEQCLNVEKVDGAADVYAFGVLLFELLAGRLPFISEDGVELIGKHCVEKPPFLRDLVPEAPPDVCVLVDSMLAKDPKERPSMQRCCTRLAALGESDRAECPLPGLQPFVEADAELFFGRRADIDTLVDRLKLARASDQRWILLEGPSGAGKSSLVQAGIRPRLEDRAPDGSRWLVGGMRPSDAPLRALAQAIVDALAGDGLEQTLGEVEIALRADPDALRSLAAHTPHGCTLLLVVEQLEELVTFGTRQEASFDALLHAALVDPECPLRLLTTLRTDFLHCLDQMPKLAGLLNKAAYRYYLPPMDEEALKQVVQGMAQRAGLKLDASLSGHMVRDAADTGCPLPLLGHTLRALWSPQDGAPTSLQERYEQMGGVGGALSNQAEKFLKKLGDEGCERAKWIILSLVQVNRGAAATRRSRSFQEALSAGGDDALAKDVLMRLSGTRFDASTNPVSELRLVVLSGEDPSRQSVDLIHETLLREVPLILRWIDRERLRLEQYTALETAAAIWQQARAPQDGLPTGALLAHFRGSVEDERRLELLGRMVSEHARLFLRMAEGAERRRRLGKQVVTAALIIAAVVTFVSALYALRQRQMTEDILSSVLFTTDPVVSHTDWRLGRTSGNWDVRDKQLRIAESFLQSLPPQTRERPEVRLVVIKTKHRLGDFALSDGSLVDAEWKYMEARAELQRANGHSSYDKELTLQWALNNSKLGKVALALNRLDDAQLYFNNALRPMENIAESSIDSIRTLATSYLEQADLELAELARGRSREAIRYYDEAISRFDIIKFNGSDEDDIRYNHSLLAEALGARASVARRTGDLKNADERLKQAMDFQKPLAEGTSSDAYHRSILARIQIELAELRYQQKNLPEAAKHFEAARTLGQALVDGDRTRKPYALILGDALRGIERLASDRGDHEDEVKARDARRALARRFTDQDPEDTRFQRLREP